MFQYQKVSITNFTGGITDKYIDGPPNTYQICVNMDITKFGTLETRRGFKWYLEYNVGGYADTARWTFLGTLNRPSADDAIIISQHDDFYVMNDEVEITFDTKTIDSNTITFSSVHGLTANDEVYINDVTDITIGADTGVGISKDIKYYFLDAAVPSTTTGRLSLTSGVLSP